MNPTILRFQPLTIDDLRAHYDEGGDPAEVLREMDTHIGERGNDGVWIYRPPLEELLATLRTDHTLPLFGIPFAVKDNIDVAGWPTTAGCPDFAYTAERDATVIARLRAAGAIPVGKTNMDQFAAGLTGTRSPHGIPRCVFDERYIAGGSSSGSAIAVAAGLTAFALGTDHEGSGCIPAAFNHLVGVKPTRGLVSTRGLTRARRSLDSVSIFAHSVADAQVVLAVVEGDDASDPFARPAPPDQPWPGPELRFGIPLPHQLEFFGDVPAATLFAQACRRMESLGHICVEIDFDPFLQAAQLLETGPWVAERLAALAHFIGDHAEAVDPTVRKVIESGASYSAVDAFRGQYELARLQKLASQVWTEIDVLFLPTTGTIYTVDEVLAYPVDLNTNLGRYTTFANLLDVCGFAIPAGFRSANSLPFGITLMGPAFSEARLGRLARQFLGERAAAPATQGRVSFAVAGVHLSGQPLHAQLTDRGAELVRACRTAPSYKFYALANTSMPKPALVRIPGFEGPGVEVEVYSLSAAAFGNFVLNVPPPMTVGTVELEDGSHCKGFLCEPWAIEGSEEITPYGGWRAYLARPIEREVVRLRARVMKKRVE